MTSKLNVFVAIDDPFIRNSAIELLEGLDVVDKIKALYFVRKVKEFPEGSKAVGLLDSKGAEKNHEIIVSLAKGNSHCFKSIILLTKASESPETYPKKADYDFVLRGTDFGKLESLLQELAKKDFCGNQQSGSFRGDMLEGFTEREMEIMRGICQGLTSREIADKLFLGNRTVENYRYNLLGKTNSKNTAELVKFAISAGIQHTEKK